MIKYNYIDALVKMRDEGVVMQCKDTDGDTYVYRVVDNQTQQFRCKKWRIELLSSYQTDLNAEWTVIDDPSKPKENWVKVKNFKELRKIWG